MPVRRLEAIFALNPKGANLRRGLEVVGFLLLPLIVLGLLHKERYWLSLSFAALFVGMSDPGGVYRDRVREMAWVAIVGTLLTAIGFAIGGGPWGWVVVSAFVVTLLSGLALKFGVHRFTSAAMLNSWFLVALTVPAGQHLDRAHSDWSGQALAWLIGAALWIGLTFVVWLVKGRTEHASNFPEIPGDITVTTLSRNAVMFAVIRAVAVTGAIAIAFGFHLPNADWMPIATLAAMKGTLDQTSLVAEQRLIGALIGAVVAAVFLMTVQSKHVLEAVIIVLASLAATLRGVNYAIYCAAMAALVLIAIDVSHPANLKAEADRVLFTLAGVGIAWLVMLLADRLQRSSAQRAT